ncbi:hypothetical protein Agub_g15247 [Astrephomene gubernaculifera]|uniref:Uncharacterized protein n=1 Tax=Astrephomene gubernaculifera TaxID=47775 RepID=A0AAD3HTK6_9CHLO|nr:hypothetical protein Agub_g15247 [Astrephomene gubernaculifera]
MDYAAGLHRDPSLTPAMSDPGTSRRGLDETPVGSATKRAKRTKTKTRRRAEAGLRNAAQVPQKTTSRLRVSRGARDLLLKLEKTMEDAVHLVDRLLAVDFSADYMGYVTMHRPPPSTPPQARIATDASLLATTPPRPGNHVQAARAVFEKLNCTLALTEAAQLSAQIANLKVTTTPPQQRPPQAQRPLNNGALTSRELRYPPTMSPAQSYLKVLTGASGLAASPGPLSARAPRVPPLSGAPLRTCVGPGDRPSPARPPLTARPSTQLKAAVTTRLAANAAAALNAAINPSHPVSTAPLQQQRSIPMPSDPPSYPSSIPPPPPSAPSSSLMSSGPTVHPVIPTLSLGPLGSPLSPCLAVAAQLNSPAATRRASIPGGPAATTGITPPSEQPPQAPLPSHRGPVLDGAAAVAAVKKAASAMLALKLPLDEASKRPWHNGRYEEPEQASARYGRSAAEGMAPLGDGRPMSARVGPPVPSLKLGGIAR